MGKSIYNELFKKTYMKNILIFLPVLLLVAVVFASGCVSPTQTGEKTLPDGTVVKSDGTMIKPDGTMIKPDGSMILPNGTMIESENKTNDTMMEKNVSMAKYSGTVLAGTSSLFIDFNKADYDKALQSDKLVLLYFYANWCPICVAEVPELKSAFNELTTDKVIGFRVNFNDGNTDDDEKNLARQFGVPYQHTKVFVKNSQQVLKSSETWNKARYLEEISKALG